jgi:hypothetical protein
MERDYSLTRKETDMMNEQHQLSIDELDAVTGGGIVEYIVETVHALGQGTENSGVPPANPHPPVPPPGTLL